MKTIVIIPARGGSKRIPRKNIKPFLGKPIIAYSIEIAQQFQHTSEVMVSTDDYEIAAIAREYGATVPFLRSAKNSDDYASTADVISEVINEYKNRGQEFDLILCIYPAAPFVTLEQLNEAFSALQEHKYDVVYPVMEFSYPIQRAVAIRGTEGKVEMIHPEYLRARSQDFEKTYHDSGQFYLISTAAFLENKEILTDNTGAIIISELEAHDIDNPEDWRVAELKYRLLQSPVN